MVKGASAGINAATPKGVVYERINPAGERYVGQAQSKSRYAERQGEHDRKLGTTHDFNILGTAKPGVKLNKMEEDFIRLGGGPSRKSGDLQNYRYQMNEKAYREAGGKIDKPTD